MCVCRFLSVTKEVGLTCHLRSFDYCARTSVVAPPSCFLPYKRETTTNTSNRVDLLLLLWVLCVCVWSISECLLFFVSLTPSLVQPAATDVPHPFDHVVVRVVELRLEHLQVAHLLGVVEPKNNYWFFIVWQPFWFIFPKIANKKIKNKNSN